MTQKGKSLVILDLDACSLLMFDNIDSKKAEELKWSEEPLEAGSSCYASQFSRSYLYHLNEVKEMNFNILLSM